MTQAMKINSDIIETNVNILNVSLVKQWIDFADVQSATQKIYNKAIKRFFQFCQENAIINPQREDIVEFRNTMLEICQPTTVRLYLVAVKMFFRFLAMKNFYPNVADNVKSPKIDNSHKKDTITTDESRKILHTFDDSTIKGLRNKAFTLLMMCCGLRSCEVVRANIKDLQRSQDKLFLWVQGKGRAGKTDNVIIPPQVERILNQYLKLRGKVDKNSPLFVSTANRNKNQRLQTQTVSKTVKEAMRRVNIDSPRITCHSLRHYAATTMLRAGLDIARAAMVLRHRNISTTMVYRHDLDRLDNDGEFRVANILCG